MMNYPDNMLKAFAVDVPLNRAERFEKFYTVKGPSSVSHWNKKPVSPQNDESGKSVV